MFRDFFVTCIKKKLQAWEIIKCALTHLQMRQDTLINSSRSFHQNMKDFFKKFFIFFKKSCQVFLPLFL